MVSTSASIPNANAGERALRGGSAGLGGEPETKATAQDANDNTNLRCGDKSYEDDGDDQHGQAEEEIGGKGFDGDAKGAGHEGFLGAHSGGGERGVRV